MANRISVGLRISPEIWKESKKFAIDKDLSIGQLVESALIHEMRR